MVTLEAVVAPGGDADAARRAIKARLAERFGFDHATVEMLGRGAGAGERTVAGGGPRVYLGASETKAGPCRSRSPRTCPPTTCSGARA